MCLRYHGNEIETHIHSEHVHHPATGEQHHPQIETHWHHICEKRELILHLDFRYTQNQIYTI